MRAVPPRRRKSLRLRGLDYALPGAYFVTVCVHGERGLLGKIASGSVSLSAAGRVVFACWMGIPERWCNVALDIFVVKPDHIHGIL